MPPKNPSCSSLSFLSLSIQAVYSDLQQAIEDINDQEDLKWWRNRRGPGMPMNWPRFEVGCPPPFMMGGRVFCTLLEMALSPPNLSAQTEAVPGSGSPFRKLPGTLECTGSFVDLFCNKLIVSHQVALFTRNLCCQRLPWSFLWHAPQCFSGQCRDLPVTLLVPLSTSSCILKQKSGLCRSFSVLQVQKEHLHSTP